VCERGHLEHEPAAFEDLYVADASIMPTIPRANTNLPTAAIAERFVELLTEPIAGPKDEAS
jgi:choline dehydrogenase-like flavoprotein